MAMCSRCAAMTCQPCSPMMDVATAGTTATVAARMLGSSVKILTIACRPRNVQLPRMSVQVNTMASDTLQASQQAPTAVGVTASWTLTPSPSTSAGGSPTKVDSHSFIPTIQAVAQGFREAGKQ